MIPQTIKEFERILASNHEGRHQLSFLALLSTTFNISCTQLTSHRLNQQQTLTKFKDMQPLIESQFTEQ